jgi:hypothetical protein
VSNLLIESLQCIDLQVIIERIFPRNLMDISLTDSKKSSKSKDVVSKESKKDKVLTKSSSKEKKPKEEETKLRRPRSQSVTNFIKRSFSTSSASKSNDKGLLRDEDEW